MPTMLPLLAQADAYVFLSIPKTLLLLLTMGGWGWVVSRLDKDLETLFLQRQLWNGVQLLAAVVALLLWLVIPFFIVGWLLALIVMGMTIVGYVFYRNSQVEPHARWKLSTDMFTKKMEVVQANKAQRQATVHLLNKDGTRKPVPSGETPFVDAHVHFEDLMVFALPRKSDRVDLGVGANGQTAVSVSIDGIRYPQQGLDAKAVVSMIDYLKSMYDLEVEDRRKKQAAAFQIHAGEHGVHTVALTTSGSTRELMMTLKLDPDMRAGVGLGKLGLLEAQRQALDPLVATRKGIVLVTAPSGQGLTTTLYSLMHEHDPYQYSIVTIEDELAYEIEGVNHNVAEVGADGATLNRKLGAIVRQDPQVVMLGKLFDPQMARTVAPLAAEARIYVGLREEDTFAALRAWIKAMGEPKAAAAGLSAIIAQRLVRKLCPTCRTPYKPDPEALRKLNLPADKVQQLFKQSGQVSIKGKAQTCPACQGMAYRGRTGVFEVMALDQQARQMIAAGQLDQLRAYLRKNRMVWLQETALAKVVDGTTSIAEVTRALASQKPA